MNIVFVESASKCKKIADILNKHYNEKYYVYATGGHITEMPKKKLSVDIENNYKPTFKYTPSKVKYLTKFKKSVKSCKCLYIASDNDNEGERIGYDVYNFFKPKHYVRVIFNEITEEAIIKAFENPTVINQNVVEAQKCRRVIDRLLGYKTTPYLWKNVGKGSSMGRVLSVVIRLIYDREQEIKKHIYDYVYKTKGIFEGLQAQMTKDFLEITENIPKELQTSKYKITSVKLSTHYESPKVPYITSSIQRDSFSKLGFSSAYTMKLLQSLYQKGHITYLRTNSIYISPSFVKKALEHVESKYGSKFVKYRNYKKTGAHECIRVTRLDFNGLNGDEGKIYDMIKKRSIATQMTDATLEFQDFTIQDVKEKYTFKGQHQRIVFPGWKIIYGTQPTDFSQILKQNKTIIFDKIDIIQTYKQPKHRYNNGTLIKKLEKIQIGTPSTYATFMETIKNRNYAVVKSSIINAVKSQETINILPNNIQTGKKSVELKEHNVMDITDFGVKTIEYLLEKFPDIVDYEFTRMMEQHIEEIIHQKSSYHKSVDILYQTLKPYLR